MANLPRKTRYQIIMEKRNEIIRQLFNDGFLLTEIGKMFKVEDSRISQIVLEKENKNGGKS